ncbi:putative RNase H-like HicB family nuclease [Nitrosospira sp. Nsp2]|uniref:type II toxin-antitoxin system HicB family antitoxin n=1 Tax=Nitrosospira sp. Nsp2 TaxID=136548 RepID=UPI000D3203D3|nr:type II toxin-antitoxin system HicB family antitoxin [Nitrosospira sp. Nsp2]PTR17474.1 putative RNase H-like HicB family nuclease [Nitrosospira sp. Nsp2]
MRYPIAIELGDEEHCYGVVVPDLPGCFSSGDSIDDAITNAHEAVMLHLESYLDQGLAFPKPLPIDEHRKNPEFDGWVWAMVSVDLSQLDDNVERVNITVPKRVLRVIDEGAKRAGENRSSFLAKAGLDAARVALEAAIK